MIRDIDLFSDGIDKKEATLEYFDSNKTSQELRMLSRSPSDCKSVILNVMIQVSQFVCNSQLGRYVTNSLNRSQSKSKSKSLSL